MSAIACADASGPAALGSTLAELRRDPIAGQELEQTPAGGLPLFQMFNGTRLTDSRARDMAEANELELIRFYPCPDASDSCAMFEVIGKRGLKTYLYQLSSESCWSPGELVSSTAPYLGGRPAPSSRARAASSTPSNQPADSAPGEAVDRPEAPNPPACFAGYRVNFRAEIENTLYVEPGNKLLVAEHRYQVYDQETWRDVATVFQRGTAWYEGCDAMSSHQTEILDPSGDVLLDESEILLGGCPGSAPYTGNPAEDCVRVADATDGLIEGIADWLDAACDAIGLVTLRPDEVSASYESDGLTIGGTKNLNVCEIGKAGRNAVGGIIESGMVLTGNEMPWQQVYDSCLADPGWYIPGVYPAASDLPPLTRDALAELMIAEEDEMLSGGCPSSYVAPVTQDMGGGTVCDADVRFECVSTTSGACECTAASVVGELICTSAP